MTNLLIRASESQVKPAELIINVLQSFQQEWRKEQQRWS
jgi:hypothetical protein